MLPIGTLVRTTWNSYQRGEIVGYGAISWPTSNDVSGDGGVMHLVYLVQVSHSSSSLGPACVPMRADRVEVIP